MLSWGCSWTCEGSGSSSTKWRRDSTSRLVKVSTGFRSSTTRSDEGREKWRGGFRGWLEEEEEKGKEIKLWKTVWFPAALQGISSLNVSVSTVKAHSKHLRQFTPSDESLLAEELWFPHKADYLSSGRSVCCKDWALHKVWLLTDVWLSCQLKKYTIYCTFKETNTWLSDFNVFWKFNSSSWSIWYVLHFLFLLFPPSCFH